MGEGLEIIMIIILYLAAWWGSVQNYNNNNIISGDQGSVTMVTLSYYQLAPSMSKIGKLRSFLKLWVKKGWGPVNYSPGQILDSRVLGQP